MLTTELVLVDVLDGIAGRGRYRREVVARLIQAMVANPMIEIVPVTSQQVWQAFERYEARPEQSWSLTDCASFLLMEQRGITEALAHDQDFVQSGFRALLQDDVP